MQKKIDISSVLFFLVLLLEDAGTFGVLPIGIAQILIFAMGIILVGQEMYERRDIWVSKKMVCILIYMFIVTLIFPFDKSSFTSFFLFCIELVVLYLYVKRMNSKKKLMAIIYNVAFILSIIGIIQEIGFVLKIPMLSNMTLYGFPRECVYEIIGRPLARVSSLYSEPASLIAVMSAAFLISFFGESEVYVKKYKTLLMVVFILLTQSTLLYFSCVLIVLLYFLFFKQSNMKKMKYLLVIFYGGTFFCFLEYDMVKRVFMKLTTLHNTSSMSTTDLSAFALLSNLKIAIEKLKDGFWLGTGYNSHRLYYETYINRLYDEVLMKLSYSDAGSMYTRSLSEFGIVGIVFLIVGIVSYFFRAYKKRNNFNLFCVIVFIVALIRDGNYIRTLSILLFIIIFIIKENNDCDDIIITR